MVAASRSTPAASISHRRAASGSPATRNASTAVRSSETSHDSSAVRAGASPIQNGTVGGAVPASRTRTTPGSTLAICHEWVPRRKMSPAIDSTAQSSLTVPMNVSSGSATTR